MIRLISILLLWSMPAWAVETISGQFAVVRGLDKISGAVADIELSAGTVSTYGALSIEVTDCRAPRANPSGDAFAYLIIHHDGHDAPVFEGWMIASSPALNAFDHHRYDVWLLRCVTS